MQQICTWMQHIASEMNKTKPLADPNEINRRIGALREMGNGAWRHMSGDQFKEIMTTAHFQTYFSTALSRSFYRQYETLRGDWQAYVYPDTVPDFRNVERHRMNTKQNMQKRREKGGMKATYIEGSVIGYGVDEFAETFSVSWRAILNDDLGQIRETPREMFKTTGDWLDSFVSALYNNSSTQAALIALGALFAGTGKLTHVNLAAAITAMINRTNPMGVQMNIKRVHLVISPGLQIQAAVILESLGVSGDANNDKNVLQRYIAGVHVDPYLPYSDAAQPWYLVADPNDIPTITLARMNGWPGPVVFMKKSDIEMITGTAPAAFLMGDFEHGDIVYGVEDIVGGWDDPSFVGVTDYRGIYYSSGTTG